MSHRSKPKRAQRAAAELFLLSGCDTKQTQRHSVCLWREGVLLLERRDDYSSGPPRASTAGSPAGKELSPEDSANASRLMINDLPHSQLRHKPPAGGVKSVRRPSRREKPNRIPWSTLKCLNNSRSPEDSSDGGRSYLSMKRVSEMTPSHYKSSSG